jgi:hypothetical protein
LGASSGPAAGCRLAQLQEGLRCEVQGEVAIGPLDALVPSHVDAFVCLRGEWGNTSDFMSQRHPSVLQSGGVSVDVIYLLTRGFDTTEDECSLATVLECRRRIRVGQRLCIHCHSGHGRTDVIVTSLMATLFGVSEEAARQFVQQARDVGREGGEAEKRSLPETGEQLGVVRRVNELVRATDASAKGPSGSVARGQH